MSVGVALLVIKSFAFLEQGKKKITVCKHKYAAFHTLELNSKLISNLIMKSELLGYMRLE